MIGLAYLAKEPAERDVDKIKNDVERLRQSTCKFTHRVDEVVVLLRSAHLT